MWRHRRRLQWWDANAGFNYTSYVGMTTEDSYPYKLPPGHCVYEFIKPVAKNTGFVHLPVKRWPHKTLVFT
jgi:hypothetical protein